MSELIYPISDQVASKVMDGEAVVINLKTGVYYSLQGSGGFIWSLIEQSAQLEEITSLVANGYNQSVDSVREDLRRFIDELEGEELIHISEKPRQGELLIAPEFANPGDYAAPDFEKFTDMAEMFALDPPLPGIAQKADEQA
jgi:Coenzyme PQQ synthesis protein D (PqqD)